MDTHTSSNVTPPAPLLVDKNALDWHPPVQMLRRQPLQITPAVPQHEHLTAAVRLI